MDKRDMNSYEIARLAGVSRSTVSRVINNYSNVPPATREKVMKVIEQYNYAPNLSAQVLAGKRTRTIGLFVIETGRVAGDAITNMLIASVIEHASASGYYVLTHIIRNIRDAATVKNVREIYNQRRIEAGIFIGASNDEPALEQLIGEGHIVGIVDQELSQGRCEPNRIVANFDNERGVALGVDYLARLGHRSIGIVNGDMNRNSGPEKLRGFLKSLQQWGIEPQQRWMLPGGFNEAAGYEAMKRFLLSGEQRPTAFIAANDSAAFGVIQAMQEQRLKVPAHMSVVGFDDHAASARFQPPLTTIRVNFNDLMRELVTLVIAAIEQGAKTHRAIVSDSELIVRESCKPAE